MKFITLLVLLAIPLLASTPDIELKKEVFSASLSERTLESSPNVTIITREDIEASGARSLSELLEIFVPGFEYLINRWNGHLWSVGGVSGDQNNKVSVAIDGVGVRMKSLTGYKAETDSWSLDGIDRIEVVTGPSGEVQGSAAIAGSINIFTSAKNKLRTKLEVISLSPVSNLTNNYKVSVLTSNIGKDGSRSSFYGSMYYKEGNGFHNSRILGKSEIDPYGGYYGDMLSAGSYGRSPLGIVGQYNLSSRILGEFFVRTTISEEPLSPFYPIDPWYGKFWSDTDSVVYVNDRRYSKSKSLEGYALWGNRSTITKRSLTSGVSKKFKMKDMGITSSLGVFSQTNVFSAEENGLYKTGFGEIYRQYGETQGTGKILFYPLRSNFTFVGGAEYTYVNPGEGLLGSLNIDNNVSTEYVADSRLKAIPETPSQEMAAFMEFISRETNGYTLDAGVRMDCHTVTCGMLSYRVGLSKKFSASTISTYLRSTERPGNLTMYRPIYGIKGEPVGEEALYRFPRDTTSQLLLPVSYIDRASMRPEKATSLSNSITFPVGDVGYVRVLGSYTQFTDVQAWDAIQGIQKNLYSYNTLSSSLETKFTLGKTTIGASISGVIATGVDTSHVVYNTHKYIPVKDVIDADSVQTYKPYKTEAETSYVTRNPSIWALSRDGFHLTNSHTYMAKAFATQKIGDGWVLAGSLRYFPPFYGKATIAETDGVQTIRDDIYYRSSYKANFSISKKIGNYSLTGYAYDVFGVYSQNSIRWQHTSAESQIEAYTLDIPIVGIKLSSEF